MKNRDERLVVLNRVASQVIERCRGEHAMHVFTYEGEPIRRLLTSGWIRVGNRAQLPQVRVHDPKHTYGRRLRSAGVSFEDRQDLLGHRSGRITTHYSAAELTRLIEASNRVCESAGNTPELVVMKGGFWRTPAKLPQSGQRFAQATAKCLKKNGAQGRNRTTDTVIFSHVLYQLSYLGLRRSDVPRPHNRSGSNSTSTCGL